MTWPAASGPATTAPPSTSCWPTPSPPLRQGPRLHPGWHVQRELHRQQGPHQPVHRHQQAQGPERDYYITKAAEAAGHLVDVELIAAIKASVSETAEDSDYGRNLRVLLAGESVTGKNVGILGSLVKVYARQQQLEAERKANPVVAGFLGDVGERITDISATAKTVVYQEGDWGRTTFLVAIAHDGHMLVWKASKVLDIETGDRFTIGAATIKAHDNYNGTDQTIIKRPTKFTVVREG
jgi:hypothetical protein